MCFGVWENCLHVMSRYDFISGHNCIFLELVTSNTTKCAYKKYQKKLRVLSAKKEFSCLIFDSSMKDAKIIFFNGFWGQPIVASCLCVFECYH